MDIIEKTINKYADKYGLEKNLIVLCEELAELSQAILKYLRQGENVVIRQNNEEILENIKNELADVEYCKYYALKLLGMSNNDLYELTCDKAMENDNRFMKHNNEE